MDLTTERNNRPWDWKSRSSTDQSARSASLTSIVDMYRRPSTSSSLYDTHSRNVEGYTDYKENFYEPLNNNVRDESPGCHIPARASSISHSRLLRTNSTGSVVELARSPSYCTTSEKESSYGELGHHRQPESCNESFMDEDEDCLRDIEKVISEAIANVAEGAEGSMGNDTIRASKKRTPAPGLTPSCFNSLPVRTFATVGAPTFAEPVARYPLKRSANSFESALEKRPEGRLPDNISRSSSQTSKWTLDPALAEFTALLSSFDRLAKSPFTHTDDEETDTMSVKTKCSNNLDILDRIALEGKVYQKGHRRNRAALCASTVGFSSDESTIDLQLTDNETISLTPKPLSPQKVDIECRKCDSLMKALPPLPPSIPSTMAVPSTNHDGYQASSTEDGAHLKLKLRINGSTSSVNAGDTIEQIGEHKDSPTPRQKLRLKISRTQLGQGKAKRFNNNSKSSRLKHCNSLADLAPDTKSNGQVEIVCRRTSLDAIEDENARRESLHSSNQFNISYPPSPKRLNSYLRPEISTKVGAEGAPRGFKPDADVVAKHRLRQKLSFFKLRFTATVAPATAKLVQPA